MLSVLFTRVGAWLRLPCYISEVAAAARLCHSNPSECRHVLHAELDVSGTLQQIMSNLAGKRFLMKKGSL